MEHPRMTATEAQSKTLSLIHLINRPGAANLEEFIRKSNYLTTARCRGHHRHDYGLMFHSLEVLDTMLNSNLFGLPQESIVIVALCHDLGKATLRGATLGHGGHPARSLYILDRCGFQLTETEREAIAHHHLGKHIKPFLSAVTNPLQQLLHLGDCVSTGLNKKGRPYVFKKI